MAYALIITHFFADWYLQSREVAVSKASNWKSMLKHLVILYIALSIVAFFYHIPNSLVLLNIVLHGIQDKIIWGGFGWIRGPFDEDYIKYKKHVDDKLFWDFVALDQTFHILIMFKIFGVTL